MFGGVAAKQRPGGPPQPAIAFTLSPHHPIPVEADYGLDAIYVWSSGEIWFLIEEGFVDQNLGAIMPGDLLSDQGMVVYRNLELLGAFAPLEDLADFGLERRGDQPGAQRLGLWLCWPRTPPPAA